jgi:hypothetical protein
MTESGHELVDSLRQEAERRYIEMGFNPVHAIDEPNKVYAPHSHHEVYLFGLGGRSTVRVGEETIDMVRGVEVHIGEGIEHEAQVGPDGAEYIFAHPKDIEPFSYKPPAQT